MRFTILCALALIAGGLQPAVARQKPGSLPWSAPATVETIAEPRRFTSGDAELSGTLYLPRNRKPVAAIVVTHSASSPLGNASLYAHLKVMLPAMGIAVFTYDRRGSGGSGTKTAGGDFTLLADDAIAAVRSLKTDPRIDPRRIGTWGLSQGGWISPLAASRSPDVAFVVAVSAPAVTADVQMLFSSTNHLRANGHSQAEIDEMTATRRAVDSYMRGTGTREAAQALIDVAKTRPWFKYTYMGETIRDRAVSGWRKEIENDPLRNLSTVKVPMLVLFGADDAVVPVADSTQRLRAIAARMPKMKVHVVAGADHSMHMAADQRITLDPKHDGTERADSAEYVAVLSSWLAARGLTGS